MTEECDADVCRGDMTVVMVMMGDAVTEDVRKNTVIMMIVMMVMMRQ